MVWKKLNFQMMWSNLSLGMGSGKAVECRDKLEAMLDEFEDKIYDNFVTGKVTQKNQEANQESMRKFQEEMRKIVMPMTIRGLWENSLQRDWWTIRSSGESSRNGCSRSWKRTPRESPTKSRLANLARRRASS